MWPILVEGYDALRTSHVITARATAYLLNGAILRDIPLSGGSVTADAKSQVRYTASVEVADPELWPALASDPLSPVGAELFVEYGIDVPGGEVVWVPLIRGPIQSVSGGDPATETLAVTVADRSKTVADSRFPQPFQTNPELTCVEVITDLIQARVNAPVVDLTGSEQECPQIDLDQDVWGPGIEMIADSMGAEVYCDRVGTFIIRATPQLTDTPVWVCDAGRDGVLITLDKELTREQVYNAVVARGERSDNTPAVWAMVVDDDPSSPTAWGGPFGKRPRFYTSALLVTEGQCEATAADLLERVKGYIANIKITQVVNPALEPGDVIELVLLDGTKQRHLVDTVPIPLSASESQALTTRTVDELEPESGG